MIKTIEDQIISRIKQDIPELHVEGFPDKPAEFRLTHPKGAILVHYQGANYSNSKSIGYIVQDKKLEFSITIVTRNLRTHEGAYFYTDKVREIRNAEVINLKYPVFKLAGMKIRKYKMFEQDGTVYILIYKI